MLPNVHLLLEWLLWLGNMSEKRYFGKFRGYVVDNKDPKKLGRLKLRVPEVLGVDTVSTWAWPCVPFAFADGGFFFIPPVDAGVWVEFEAGDIDRPLWVGCWWAGSREPEDGVSEVPVDARTNDYPEINILKVPSGTGVKIDKDGNVIIELATGAKLHLGGIGGKAVARKGDSVTGGNSITGASSKIFAID